MTGWKTKLGGFLLAISPMLPALGVEKSIADCVGQVGMALLGVGIGHKIEKSQKVFG